MQIYCWDVGFDAIQLYPYSVTHPMPTSLFRRWDLNTEMGRITHPRNQTINFKNRVCPIFNEPVQNVKLKTSTVQANKRQLTVSQLMDFVIIANLCSKQWALRITFVQLKMYVHLSLMEILNAVARKESSIT